MVPDESRCSSYFEGVKTRLARDTAEECSVCMEPYSSEQWKSELPCKHVFHNKCAFQWLRKKSTCPLCRHRVPKIGRYGSPPWNLEYYEYDPDLEDENFVLEDENFVLPLPEPTAETPHADPDVHIQELSIGDTRHPNTQEGIGLPYSSEEIVLYSRSHIVAWRGASVTEEPTDTAYVEEADYFNSYSDDDDDDDDTSYEADDDDDDDDGEDEDDSKDVDDGLQSTTP